MAKEFFHFLQSMLPEGLGNVCSFGFFSATPSKPLESIRQYSGQPKTHWRQIGEALETDF